MIKTALNTTVTRPQRDSIREQDFSLNYVRTLTDDTGMIQHGLGGIPHSVTGYTVDDNARAFLAMARLWRAFPARRAEFEPLLRRYLGFMVWMQRTEGPVAGRFVNFVSYDRRFLEECGSEDSLGRCVWALGEAVSGPLPAGCELAAWTLLHRALPHVDGLVSPRARLYAILGLARALPQESDVIHRLLEPIVALWKENQLPGWHWFEPYMTYDNARMVEAVYIAGQALAEPKYLQIAGDAANFLTEHSFVHDSVKGDYLEPVGNLGWWRRGAEKARFDQQTIEAGAYADLYRLLGDAEREQWSREWFLGRNIHGLPVYDADTGACHDSLIPDGMNRNQGAESALSYLLTLA